MEWLVFAIIILFLLILPVIVVKCVSLANVYDEKLLHKETEQRKMVTVSPVKLPFSVAIQNGGDANDCISVLIKGEKKCTVTYYICVHSKELQKAIEEKRFTEDRKLVDVLNLISYWISEPQNISFAEDGSHLHDYSFDLLPRDARAKLDEALNDPSGQEQYIPIVLCVQLHHQEREAIVDDNNVVSVVSSISSTPGGTSCHGSPSSSGGSYKTSTGNMTHSPSDSSLSGINQYAIMEQHIEVLDGRVFLLKKLYKSGVEPLDEPQVPVEQPGTSSHLEQLESTELCLVCQEYPVTRALLPCRHVCTCKRCFSKLDDLCPICRQLITSYFVVKQEDEIPEVELVNQNNDDISSLIQNEGIWAFIKSIWNAS